LLAHLSACVVRQTQASNGLTAAPASALSCPNDQYGPGRTCEDFGDQMVLSADGKTLLTSGGFSTDPSSFRTYVYQTEQCVSTTGSGGSTAGST
jgi:hypothetical protein